MRYRVVLIIGTVSRCMVRYSYHTYHKGTCGAGGTGKVNKWDRSTRVEGSGGTINGNGYVCIIICTRTYKCNIDT